MSSGEFCLIQLEGWSGWWEETRRFRIKVYVSIILFFLSAVLAYPIARTIFFLVRRAAPKRWIWPDEARVLMMWQTALLCRAGLLWVALIVSRISMFLCKWPSWLFGICFIIWMDAGGNVLREVIVRKGIKGYTNDEKPGRITLLYEGTTLAKILLLVLVIYTYYIASIVQNDNSLRAVSSIGFFLAIALSLLPLLRNVMGAHYMFMNNMLRLKSRIQLHDDVRGIINDAPLGFLVVETAEKSKVFVPAGRSVMSATTLHNDQIGILRLDITLPSTATPTEVRMFIQELDRLAAASTHAEGVLDLRPLHGSVSAAASPRTRVTSKLLLDWDWQEQLETLDRARAHYHIIELSTSSRWTIHFKTFIRAANEQGLEETRSAYIEEIMRLQERWQQTPC